MISICTINLKYLFAPTYYVPGRSLGAIKTAINKVPDFMEIKYRHWSLLIVKFSFNLYPDWNFSPFNSIYFLFTCLIIIFLYQFYIPNRGCNIPLFHILLRKQEVNAN